MPLGVGAYFAISCFFKVGDGGFMGDTMIHGEANRFWWRRLRLYWGTDLSGWMRL